jgi:tetratricopeptide (TPR) repeat protein
MITFVRRRIANEEHSAFIEVGHVVQIEPMPPDAIRSIITSMAGRLSRHVADKIVEWANGSPLLAQNALRFFADTGAIVPGPAGWECIGPLPAPPEVLSDRVRLLPSLLRSVLKVAAVIGFRGRIDVLADAIGGSGAWCAIVVTELARRGLLHAVSEPQETGAPADGSPIRHFIFTHDTVREEVLGDEACTPLPEIHRQVARAMLGLRHMDEFDLAFHLAASGDLVAALPYAIRAARTARNRYSLDTAHEYYKLAISVQNTHDLFREMGEALMLSGHYGEALVSLEQSLEKCADSETDTRASVLRLLGETHFKSGNLERAEHYFVQALHALGEPIPSSDHSFLRAAIKEPFKVYLDYIPHRHSFRTHLRPHHAALKAAIFGNLAYCWWFHNSIRALWAQTREMDMARHLALNGPQRAHAYATRAVLCGGLFGRSKWATRNGERALAIRKLGGDEWGEAHALHLYGAALVISGDYGHAISLLTAAVSRFDRTADRWEAHMCRWHRALALYRLGDRDAAAQEAEMVYQLAVAIGDRQAAIGAACIRILSCDGEGGFNTEQAAYPNSFDGQSAITHLLGQAIGHLGAHLLDDAEDVLTQAANEIRHRRVVNAYVAPVWSWRATVARWQAEASPPQSAASRRWATRAVGRTAIAAAASCVYPAEGVHVKNDISGWPALLRHAFVPGWLK